MAQVGVLTAAAALLVGVVLQAGCAAPAPSSQPATGLTVPAPLVDETPSASDSEVAVLAGGCFWGIQGVFQHVSGVTQAVSGYAGGSGASADYDTVSTGKTGHAESVQITFNPRQISYGHLLQIYFSVHDPTELNRQGPDIGTEYRSAIFPMSDDQARVAQAYIDQLGQAGAFSRPIVTRVEASQAFFPAETYHQNYLTNHPDDMYIEINDLPKIEHLKNLYPDLYRVDPVLVLVK